MSCSIIPTNYIPTSNEPGARDLVHDKQLPIDQTASDHSAVVQTRYLNVLDRVGGAQWDQLVTSHPDCSPFHCAAWARVISHTYGHNPYYLCCSVNDQPAGVIPLVQILSPVTGRRGVCLPFSDACGPLVFGGNGSKLLRDELSRLAADQRWDYYEIRGGEPLEETLEPAVSYYGHQLRLYFGSEGVFTRFRNSTKAAVRQASRANLLVQIDDSSDAVEEFYQLHVRTRRRHGVPPQPSKFFMNIHEHMVKAGLGFVVLVRTGLHAIAGAVFFQFGRRAIYKYAASDLRFGKFRGNNLVMWKAIQRLIEQGTEVLDLGRTATDNAGLRRFKLGWGAEEYPIHYYRFGAKRSGWVTSASKSTSNLAHHIFRNLPVGLGRIAGALAYPHLD